MIPNLKAESTSSTSVVINSRKRAAPAFKEMCCLNEAKENSAHKEGTSTRINRDESDVQKLVGCFDSG